jgi:hypothetical protein
MKSVGERNWMKMSMHGKKEFLSHHNFDKGLATATWKALPPEVKQQYEDAPVVNKEVAIA